MNLLQWWRSRILWVPAVVLLAACSASAQPVLRCFPVGPIFEYRWKLLELALAHTGGAGVRLVPASGSITQPRSLILLESGALDVLALGSTAERQMRALPIPVDILKGIIGFRVLLVRRADLERIRRMDDATLRRDLSFGMEQDWADLPIMVAAGLKVEAAAHAENLFGMLSAGRFDAYPRGLNEAIRELADHQAAFPGLALEPSRALYFPYPIYFWVARNRPGLARRIERGLRRALADGSFRRLFTTYHAREILQLKEHPRHVLVLPNPFMPTGTEPDTRWWWPR